MLNVFNAPTLKQTFWKELEYLILVDSTKIKKTIFPCKAALSEPNNTTNEWGVQNRLITKNGILPLTTLLFLKIVLRFKKLLQIVDLMYQLPKCLYSYFLKALEF